MVTTVTEFANNHQIMTGAAIATALNNPSAVLYVASTALEGIAYIAQPWILVPAGGAAFFAGGKFVRTHGIDGTKQAIRDLGTSTIRKIGHVVRPTAQRILDYANDALGVLDVKGTLLRRIEGADPHARAEMQKVIEAMDPGNDLVDDEANLRKLLIIVTYARNLGQNGVSDFIVTEVGKRSNRWSRNRDANINTYDRKMKLHGLMLDINAAKSLEPTINALAEDAKEVFKKNQSKLADLETRAGILRETLRELILAAEPAPLENGEEPEGLTAARKNRIVGAFVARNLNGDAIKALFKGDDEKLAHDLVNRDLMDTFTCLNNRGAIDLHKRAPVQVQYREGDAAPYVLRNAELSLLQLSIYLGHEGLFNILRADANRQEVDLHEARVVPTAVLAQAFVQGQELLATGRTFAVAAVPAGPDQAAQREEIENKFARISGGFQDHVRVVEPQANVAVRAWRRVVS